MRRVLSALRPPVDRVGVDGLPPRYPRSWFDAPTASGPTPRLRDLGHLRPVFENGLLDVYLRAARTHGDDFRIWLGPTPHVVPVRPESVRRVLTDEASFVRNVQPTERLFGKGLLRLEGDSWRKRRALLAPAFHGLNLQAAVPIIQDEIDKLIVRWQERRQTFRPSRDLSFLMARIVGRFLFGFEFDEGRHGGSRLHRALATLAAHTVTRHLLPTPIADAMTHKAVTKSRRVLDELSRELYEDGTQTPILSALRTAERRGVLNREVVLDEIRSLVVAGHETSATAAAWAVALLPQHPDQARSLEGDAQLAEHAATTADVGRLASAIRWSKEAMRLFPPVPLSISQAVRDTELGPLRVPKGTPIDVSSYVLHRLPWLHSEPDRFDPNRFKQTMPTGTYLPFLLGPHTCLGIRLALLELPLTVARLASHFEFELPEGPPEVNLRLSLHPRGFVARARARAVPIFLQAPRGQT